MASRDVLPDAAKESMSLRCSLTNSAWAGFQLADGTVAYSAGQPTSGGSACELSLHEHWTMIRMDAVQQERRTIATIQRAKLLQRQRFTLVSHELDPPCTYC